MNKTELIAAVAKKAGVAEMIEQAKADNGKKPETYGKLVTEEILKAFTDVVAEELAKGEKIQVVGFGTFEVSERAAREGRNPKTGEKMPIAASKTPKFKAGKALKDQINA